MEVASTAMETEETVKQKNVSINNSSLSMPVEDPFTWLRQYARGSSYISYSEFSSHPACSFDFGHEGYVASCNYGGEWLQMTAPSKKYGILFARGDSEYSLYLSLARAQKEHGRKSSFGLKIPSSSNIPVNATGPIFSLGTMLERGSYNYRWPFNEYSLQADEPLGNPAAEVNTKSKTPQGVENCDAATQKRDKVDVGVCSMLSFVKNDTFYQVLRLDRQRHPGVDACGKVPEGTELILTIDGPMRFQAFLNPDQPNADEAGNTTRPVAFTEGKLKNGGKLACFSGELETGRQIRWEASLREFDIVACEYKDIVLESFGYKLDHSSQGTIQRFPVYKAILEPTDLNSSRIFIASFRLYEAIGADGDSDTQSTAESLRNLDIPKVIGITARDDLATVYVWQSIFLERQERIEGIFESYEANLVGRCLEKILDVDLVPAAWTLHPYMALVSNTFLKPNVDLKSIFWKTRFLVKADLLLTRMIIARGGGTEGFQVPELYDQTLPLPHRERGSDLDIPHRNQATTTVAMVKRIRRAIGDIMAYLVIALLRPSNSRTILMPEDSVPGESNYYYVMITIWYVVKHYPIVKWNWQEELKENGIAWGRGALGTSSRLPSRRLNPLSSDIIAQTVTKDKDSLLKWFHHESILSLQAKAEQGSPVIPVAWTTDIAKVKRLRAAAKTALIKRISSALPYQAEDEIVDRLAFLAEELWPESKDAMIVVNRVAQRIRSREFTRTINSCQILPGEEGHTGGPWEIHALCHHSRLVVTRKEMSPTQGDTEREEIMEELEHLRRKFWPFLTSEISLTPCWERSDSAARRGFLRSEATAVLASTILDIFQNDLDYIQINQKIPKYSRLGPVSGSENGSNIDHEGTLPWGANSSAARSSKRSRKVYFRDSVSRLRFTGEPATVKNLLALQLDTLERLSSARGLEPHIDYLRFQPPQSYHPEEFFNSLDDTPELYTESVIKDTPIPEGIRSALYDGGFQNESILKLSKNEKQKVKSLSIIDIKTPDPLSSSKVVPVDADVEQLNDSLVDQQVRHRILVAFTPRNLPAELLRWFVYVLHREMVDGFNNHTMRVSRFSLQKRTSVMAYITLRSWQLIPTEGQSSVIPNSMCNHKPSSLVEDEEISLPDNLRKALESRERHSPHDELPKMELPKMELKVSSICISTNEFGDFSKCSIITDLVQRSDLELLGARVKEIWDYFIHQPQTGRFLVFSVILALVCRKISQQCHDIIKKFVDRIISENHSAEYLRDSAWLQGRDAERRLKLSLWSLEALYKLSNTMTAAVRTVEQAKAELCNEIERGPGKRSEELEKMCLANLENLEISLAELTAVKIKLERRVELNSRYSTALSTVLALADSRAAFRQNNTIQQLTYITIGCLPIGLSAAIFAVPQDQNVLKRNMGLRWFIVLVVVLAVVIFAIAITIDLILHPSHHGKPPLLQDTWAWLNRLHVRISSVFARPKHPIASGWGGSRGGVDSSQDRSKEIDEKGNGVNGKLNGSGGTSSMV